MGISDFGNAHLEVIERLFMRKRAGYMFTNRVHPKRAIMSVILGCISILSILFSVYRSYATKGEHLGSAGMTGLLITLFSLTGLILGLITFMEKDRYPLFPVLGMILNGISLGGISLILYAGASLG